MDVYACDGFCNADVIPSPKFQAKLAAPVEVFVKLTLDPKQVKVSAIKLGIGNDRTVTTRVAEFVHPVNGFVQVQVKVFGPTPAIEGLNVPFDPLVIPDPDHVPPTGENPVKLNTGDDKHVFKSTPGVI